MYLTHFGLEQYPFALTPDTEFYLDYAEFRDGLDVLECALLTGEGITKIIGDAGTGKSLLCRQLLNCLDACFVPVHVSNPAITPNELHVLLANKLGVDRRSSADMTVQLSQIGERLHSLHTAGRKVVLLFDEAQSLSDEMLEAIRLLSNIETEKTKLLQICLFGQPQLDRRLQQDHLKCLQQRIIFSHSLGLLSNATLSVYLQHRMHVAGYRGINLFTQDALRLLHYASRGVPRVVNVLSHKALLTAFGRGDHRIDSQHIRSAIADTEGVALHRPLCAPAAWFHSLFRPVYASP